MDCARLPRAMNALTLDPPPRHDVAAVPAQREPADRKQAARDRSATRRERALHDLVPGRNGRPYAMRRTRDGTLVDDLPHGNNSTYSNRLCRCGPCTEAHNERDRGSS